MRNPTVSFVIPCYKLSHLLPECIRSICAQTYEDFEILIMDDCSPDDTQAVAASFHDQRIRYVRNNTNLGHLRNYNKGIELTRGKYIWLISADDYLRRPYVLERYVDAMEHNPQVGYTFCPAVGVRGGQETRVLDYSFYADRDCVVKGHKLLRSLFNQNIVVAASALVRRDCYEKVSNFPIDATWAGTPVDFGWNGDWYLWCVFALYYDVAYFAEPMVCYREHELSMTTAITRPEYVDNCAMAEIGMLWLVREKASQSRMTEIASECLSAVADEYVRQATSKQYRCAVSSMTMEQIEDSLCRSTSSEKERACIRARLFSGMADKSLTTGETTAARSFYLTALKHHAWMPKTLIKLALLALGRPGDYLRRFVRWVRATQQRHSCESSLEQ
jgi:hypothetical protein